ncbi:MAG: TetR-like C-terminal domain-containing protein [Kineosporiaceae bacterium]
MTQSVARGVRERARAEITRQIVETARAHLATDGAAGLSLRAVARDLGMVSSAVYRYMPSRDDLLTALIVEAYRGLGDAVVAAEAAVPRERHRDRWTTASHAVRDWALTHPHEYALIYGSPVPGYAAPADTVGPATIVAGVLSQVLADAWHAGQLRPDPPAADGDDEAFLARALAPLEGFTVPEFPRELLMRGLMAITFVFGAVTFELFGHRHNVVDADPDVRRAYAELEWRRIAALAGLGEPPRR